MRWVKHAGAKIVVVFEGRDGTPPAEAMKLAQGYLRGLLREYGI